MNTDGQITPELIRSALEYVPANLPRDEWARVAMAIKSEMPSDEGFDLFDTWSQSAGEAYNAKDARSTWRSISETGGVTIGTLFHIAKQDGFVMPNNGTPPSKPDPVAMAALKAAQIKRKAHEDAATEQRYRKAQTEANAIWKVAQPATEHAYLITKQIKHNGTRVIDANQARVLSKSLSPELQGQLLVIPMTSGAGDLWNLQFVTADGIKRPVTGGRTKGLYHVMGNPTAGEVLIAEGYATSASIHEATGLPVACAFSAGNLLPVSMVLRSKYPQHRLTLCADDDLKAGNTGMTAATAAAEAVNGYLAVPNFGKYRPDDAKDFNDLACISGDAAVKRCIEAAKQMEPTRKNDGVILINGADLQPEPVLWLWQDWLARGKLHLLAGAPGQGKTTIALSFCATVTLGGRWPDGLRSEAGNVLIWSGEDDPADTILPRLIAAGADRKRVYFVDGARINGEVTSFDPARDMAGLQTQAERIGGVSLIVIDPIVSAVTGDSHKNTETRRALQPLVDLAANMGAALLGITHLSKGGQGSDPAQRVIGSVAFTAVARVVLVAAKVKAEEGEDKRILARGKSNIGPDDGGVEYSIAQVEALPGIQASRIEWGQSVKGTARELLTDPNEVEDAEGQSAVTDAQEFLRQELAECPTPTKTVKKAAAEAGISWASVRRAADALKVSKKKGGIADGWYWSLPPENEKSRRCSTKLEDAQPFDLEQVEHLQENLSTFEVSDPAKNGGVEVF